jgi:hypothetical protein
MRGVAHLGFTLVLAALGPAGAAAQDFEGTVTIQRMTADEAAVRETLGSSPDEEIEPETLFAVPLHRLADLAGRMDQDIGIERFVYSIKGTTIRVNAVGEGAEESYALMDYDTGTLRLVQPLEKIYIEWGKDDLEALRSMLPAPEKDKQAGAGATVRSLGKKREINGMACEAYRIEWDGVVARAWTTRALGDLGEAFKEFEERMAMLEVIDPEADEPEIVILVADKGFPVLEQTLRRKRGADLQYETSEIISVERKRLSSDLFEVPEGFEKRGLLEMLRGKGEAGGG